MYLLDNGVCIAKKKTKVARKTLEPLYQQLLSFEESPQGKVLQVRAECRPPRGKACPKPALDLLSVLFLVAEVLRHLEGSGQCSTAVFAVVPITGESPPDVQTWVTHQLCSLCGFRHCSEVFLM